MLSTAKLVANLRASDLEAAIAFYRDGLGLELAERRELMPGHPEAIFRVGDGSICIEQGPVTPSSGTPVVFEVDDVDAELRELRGRGVAPEEYDLPHLKTVDGVVEVGPLRAAWVKDPDGNHIGILAPAGVPAA